MEKPIETIKTLKRASKRSGRPAVLVGTNNPYNVYWTNYDRPMFSLKKESLVKDLAKIIDSLDGMGLDFTSPEIYAKFVDSLVVFSYDDSPIKAHFQHGYVTQGTEAHKKHHYKTLAFLTTVESKSHLYGVWQNMRAAAKTTNLGIEPAWHYYLNFRQYAMTEAGYQKGYHRCRKDPSFGYFKGNIIFCPTRIVTPLVEQPELDFSTPTKTQETAIATQSNQSVTRTTLSGNKQGVDICVGSRINTPDGIMECVRAYVTNPCTCCAFRYNNEECFKYNCNKKWRADESSIMFQRDVDLVTDYQGAVDAIHRFNDKLGGLYACAVRIGSALILDTVDHHGAVKDINSLSPQAVQFPCSHILTDYVNLQSPISVGDKIKHSTGPYTVKEVSSVMLNGQKVITLKVVKK